MNYTNIISTTDPITGFNITSLKDRPHLVEGDDTNNLTIYFESKASLQAYRDIPVEHPERDLSVTRSNPTGDYAS
ncbi:MAG: hypothetical protein ACM3NI_11375 [Bacteroidota bacterium]